jgi:hypothetical protein
MGEITTGLSFVMLSLLLEVYSDGDPEMCSTLALPHLHYPQILEWEHSSLPSTSMLYLAPSVGVR